MGFYVDITCFNNIVNLDLTTGKLWLVVGQIRRMHVYD